MKIISAVGARPNFVKLMPLYNELKRNKRVKHLIVHSGQHYDYIMSRVFFEEFNLPKPDYYLGVGPGTHAEQTGKTVIRFEKILFEEKPDLVIVYGDINSTLAFSLAAKKLLIPLAHVEAGLRSFDMRMPEEINRRLTDQISDFLFVTEQAGVDNLLKEGISRNKIFLVGDLMIDTLIRSQARINNSKILQKLNVERGKYALLTLHRPSNVDNVKSLRCLFDIFYEIQKKIKIIFPVHPGTEKKLAKFNVRRFKNLRFITPLGYLDFIALLSRSKFVLTDSGGIQTESTFLNIPCITLRQNTEKIATITSGTNIVCGNNKNKILKTVTKLLKKKKDKSITTFPRAELTARKIVETLKNKFRF